MVTKEIAIEKINCESNVRTIDDIGDLAKSIEARGLLQPIVVSRAGNGRYTLIAGRRRLEAMRMLNESTIPAVINDDIGSHERDFVKLAENIQRQQMSPVEVVAAVDAIKERNSMVGDRAICENLGKSQTWLQQQRKAAAAYKDLIRSGISPEAVKSLSTGDLYEVSLQEGPGRKKAAERIIKAGKGKKGKARAEVRADRNAEKRGSYKDEAGGISILTKGLRVVVLCRDDDARQKLMRRLYKLKSELA